MIADGGWRTCGVAAEISALVSEAAFEYLKVPIRRVTLPDCPAPASSALERQYYPTGETIIQSVRRILIQPKKRVQLIKLKSLNKPHKRAERM
jgi:pyruvate dehydrogenase E1 component beta subunit